MTSQRVYGSQFHPRPWIPRIGDRAMYNNPVEHKLQEVEVIKVVGYWVRVKLPDGRVVSANLVHIRKV